MESKGITVTKTGALRSRTWVFLAVVGERPGAIAAAFKTWTRRVGLPDRTVLLATAHVMRGGITGRLEGYIKGLGAVPEIVEVSTDLAASGASSSVIEMAATLKKSVGEAGIAFYADPGLKYLVAALAREFGREALYLHADTRRLVAIDRGGRPETSYGWRLVDVGLDELLALHGLTVRAGGALPPAMGFVGAIPPSVRRNAVIEGGRETVTFHLLQECRGWPAGLNWVCDKEDVRALERLPNVLNGLYPLVSVCTRKRAAWERARTVGLAVIAAKGAEVARWISGHVAPPGWVTLGSAPRPSVADRCGKGGTGPPLVVWVGPDPSSTLRSLYTFEPREALVLYDGGTPASKRSARRLMKLSAELPCRRIYFQPSDLVGRGLADAGVGGLFEAGSERVVADISPGTNGQACATALLSGVELWSQRTKDGKAVSLDGTCSRPLQTPPALVQARARGGRLSGKPDAAHDWSAGRIGLLCGLAEGIRRQAVNGARVNWRSIEQLKKTARKRGLMLPRSPAGAWFEQLVAGLAVAGGADEVWLNVKWAWRRPSRDPRVFRDEVDLLVRRGGNVFVVSCKLMTPGQFPLKRDASETEAVTRDGVGRLAVPVLVRLRLDREVVRQRLAERRGAVYLDLRAITPPKDFGDVLDEVARNRRTT